MRTRKASDLQADVLALLDEVGSNKPLAADVLEAINQRWCDEYGKLIQAGIQWNMQTSTFATAAGVDVYGVSAGAFAATYWKTGGVDVQITSGRWRPCHRFQFEQRAAYDLSTFNWPEPVLYDTWGGTADATGADGTQLKFVTMPGAAYTVRHFWYPAPQRLASSNDVFDGVAGAERVLVYGAAGEMALMLEQFELSDRLLALAAQKSATMLSLLRDRNVGEAPMARVVRGRPSLRRRGLGGGWTR